MMYEKLQHHMKGEFMRMAPSGSTSLIDAVEISDMEDRSILLSDFLSK
jgi:hypothetical protein